MVARHTWPDLSSLKTGVADGSDLPGKVNVKLDMLIEAKSLDGYHLVFVPDSRLESRARRIWPFPEVGEFAFLRESGCSTSLAHRIVNSAKEIAYPGGSALISGLSIDPPDIPTTASAYRETNVEGSQRT